MNEKSQRAIANYLLDRKVANFVGVPDSTLKYFINEGLRKNKLIIATREEEAIGIAAGISLADSYSVVFMQNAGFANSISTIASLVQLYGIPLIFLIGWRGFLTTDAPEHIKIGKIQPQLLKILGLQSKIITETNWKESCRWALKRAKTGVSSALIIKREFHD